MIESERIPLLLFSGVQVSIGVPEGELSDPPQGKVRIAWAINGPDMSLPDLERWLQNCRQEIWVQRVPTATNDFLSLLRHQIGAYGYKVMGIWEIPDSMIEALSLWRNNW